MAETSAAVIASANNLSVKYGTQVVLDGATIAFTEGEHIGLVGRNGSGKSTFLQIAAGVAQADSGEFTRRRDLVTGYMPQLSGLDDAATVHANILSGAQRILDLIAEYERVPGDSPLSATLLDQIGEADGWNLEHRIKSLITNLHAPESDRVVGTLSGGEKRRVALCRALLARPDFLILDEPTNHLDTGSIEWLEDFLARYAGTCLFVTHDRYFLDRVATRIVELSRGQFISYDGNYTDYLLARAQRQAVEETQEHQRQKFLKRELQWVRKAPRARRTKSVDRVERYFEMAAQEAPEAELDVELIIPTPPKLANRIIELRDVSVELGGRTLFQHVNLNLAAGERLGVVGRNGLGKSSLLKVILQELPAASGAVEIGARTQINYVDQNRLLLDDEKTVWEEVGSGGEHVTLGEQSITLRAYLRRFLFSEDRINTKISQLSGGERSRVLLAKILKRGGNVLDARRTDERSRSRNVALARGSARRLRRLRHRGQSRSLFSESRLHLDSRFRRRRPRGLSASGTTITTWKNEAHPARFAIHTPRRPQPPPSQRKAKTNRGSLSGKKSANGNRWRRIFSRQKTRCRIWRPRLPRRIFMRNRARRFSSWRRN